MHSVLQLLCAELFSKKIPSDAVFLAGIGVDGGRLESGDDSDAAEIAAL